MRRNQSGFTLIELMVVLAIIATLVATVSLGINMAIKHRDKTLTRNRLDQIGAWLDQASSADNLGRYPSAETSKLKGPGIGTKGVKYGAMVGQPNETNVGIETVFAAMAIPELGGVKSVDLDEQAYGNTDDDEMGSVLGTLPDKQLKELVDAWGNPFIYFAASDYKKPKPVAQYVLDGIDGEIVKVAPAVNAQTGKFLRIDSFQLFSLGPDGQPDTGDEIHYGVVQ